MDIKMKLTTIAKSLLDKILDILESFGRARAAAELAHYGHYQAANELINGKQISTADKI
jgi:hypothetical protein